MNNNESTSNSDQSNSDIVHLVWKVPYQDYDDCPFAERGVYPTGQLMSIHRTRDDAEDHAENLRDAGPSERFGETMDDAPYEFVVTRMEVGDT